MCTENRNINKTEKIKEEDFMAVLAKPSSRTPVISVDKSKEFIKRSNEQKLTKAQLEEYKKSSALFKKNF